MSPPVFFVNLGADDVSKRLSKYQYELAVWLTRVVSKEGQCVLIFVSGMFDIVELASQFEASGGARYQTVPIWVADYGSLTLL